MHCENHLGERLPGPFNRPCLPVVPVGGAPEKPETEASESDDQTRKDGFLHKYTGARLDSPPALFVNENPFRLRGAWSRGRIPGSTAGRSIGVPRLAVNQRIGRDRPPVLQIRRTLDDDPSGAYPPIRKANLPPFSHRGESSRKCGMLTLSVQEIVWLRRLPDHCAPAGCCP